MAVDRSNHPEYSFSPSAVMLMGYTSAEATCRCGRRYYAGEGDQCPRCTYEVCRVQAPFLLRDECGACGLPCSNEWCPYCEGVEEGRRDLEVERRRFAASVTQLTDDRRMAANQLELEQRRAERRAATWLEVNRILDQQVADLTRQRDLALADLAEAEERAATLLQRLDKAATEVVRLRDQQAALRTAARRTLVGALTLVAAGGLSWLCWDRLPGWSPTVWSTIAVGLGALLVGRRWRGRVDPGCHVEHITDLEEFNRHLARAGFTGRVSHKKLPGGSPDNASSP